MGKQKKSHIGRALLRNLQAIRSRTIHLGSPAPKLTEEEKGLLVSIREELQELQKRLREEFPSVQHLSMLTTSLTEFNKQLEDKTAYKVPGSIHKEIKKITENYDEKLDELLGQRKQQLVDQQKALSRKEEENRKLQDELGEWRAKLEAFASNLDSREAKVSEAEKQWAKHGPWWEKEKTRLEKRNDELNNREEEATCLEKNAAEVVKKFLPKEFACGWIELGELFKGIDWDNPDEHPYRLLLVAQLNLFRFVMTEEGKKYLNDCLKEIGKAVLAICHQKEKLEAIPQQLADKINADMKELDLTIVVPKKGDRFEKKEMIDLSGVQGAGEMVKEVSSWGLRDKNGMFVVKAEVKSS